MGATDSQKLIFLGIEISDWIQIASIVINSGLAIWIIITIQNRFTNRRILKDHFINEFKDIKSEYKNCLNNLFANKTRAKNVIPWLKLMNIKVSDLMEIANNKYKIDKNKLSVYQVDFGEIIVNSDEFVSQFSSNGLISLSDTTRTKLIYFQQVNAHIFNDIIIEINDSKQ